MGAFGCQREMVLHHIGASVKSWQRPVLRRRLDFALLGMLIALSYALLLAGEEAQTKGGNSLRTEALLRELSEDLLNQPGRSSEKLISSRATREPEARMPALSLPGSRRHERIGRRR
jgi:hypothetical protein